MRHPTFNITGLLYSEMESNYYSASNIPNLPIIWIIGGPGSGKSTLCNILAENRDFHHISTGKLLREVVKSNSSISKSILEKMKQGELVDTEIIVRLFVRNMVENISHTGYLIDGFPREAGQGYIFEEVIRPADCILSLMVSEETMKKRIMKRSKSSKRPDDNEESIEKRLKTYRGFHDEIVTAFKHKIREINAERTINEVYQEAVTALEECLDGREDKCACK